MICGVSNADVLTNPQTGEIWITDDKGAYTTDNSEIYKSGDNYLGEDGRVYKRIDDHLIQIGGPRQQQATPPQQINIQIRQEPAPVVSWPFIVPGIMPRQLVPHMRRPHR